MKGKMSKIRTSVLFLSLSACVFAAWDQARLERDLHAYEPEDCMPDDDPGLGVYLRQQDALRDGRTASWPCSSPRTRTASSG